MFRGVSTQAGTPRFFYPMGRVYHDAASLGPALAPLGIAPTKKAMGNLAN